MEHAHLTPAQWRGLSEADRIDLMAYQRRQQQRRADLRREVIDKLPNEFGALAQILIELMD